MQEQEQPQTKVLTTPELLQIILLHLDNRTLLVSAQRVCQTWTVLIQRSPVIQQALFFQPFTPKPEKGKWHAKSIWNSILPSPLKKDTKLDQGSINEYESSYTRPIYNPLLVQAFRPFFPSVYEYPLIHDNEEKATETEYEGKEQEKENPFSFKPLEMLSSPQKKSAYKRKEASWRKMLLRQPPVYGGVTIFKMHHAMGGDSYKCYTAPPKTLKTNQEETLKMGHLFTTLTQNPDLYFGRFGQTRVYWSAYVPPYEPSSDRRGGDIYPPQDGSYDPRVKRAFTKAIKKSEVVVFSREVIQCCVWEVRELTEEENLREEIVKAEAGGSKGAEK
ncbi:hypothetical protein N7474_006044 [Penicillium riverlandense]|uniref:uncharacterized protein n=1 Tax=Penicillium riverlandense TaxID=1903569 RepID=UPI002549B6ED|nr:uncharacterized protein N7474_006044 [Penicillium riverlandense]KAJ5820453.1 hypothetical protein N7474_006044 [Penicillium riverlandense]